MEITDNFEIKMVVTARKIRQFNESISQLRKLNALENIAQLEKTRDELEREFQWLSAQVRATEVVA